MKVLVATKSSAVLEALRANEEVEIEPALFTHQVFQLIPTAQLVIIDPEDVVEYGYELGALQDQLDRFEVDQNIPHVTSEVFLADPDRCFERARKAWTSIDLPGKFTIGFAAYSGGVGKTTLALDTALHFARRTQLPTLMIEFVYGASALAALTGIKGPFLWDLATNENPEPTVHDGVTLVPMDYDNCSLLPAEDFGRYLTKLMAQHTLTVVDTFWPHGLIRSIEREVNQWYVVAAPRLDALENAKKLAAELGAKVSIVVNQKRGLGDALALAGSERALELDYVDRVDRWEGKLGEKILGHTYGPAWNKYSKKKRRGLGFGQLFRRKKKGTQGK